MDFHSSLNLTDYVVVVGYIAILLSLGFWMSLAATGIDRLNPCEPHSHMDVKEIRAQYPELVLWGGVDNSYMLVYDSPEQVQKRVEELKVFGRDGGLLIGSTGQVHPACKLDNLITMIETVHGHEIV